MSSTIQTIHIRTHVEQTFLTMPCCGVIWDLIFFKSSFPVWPRLRPQGRFSKKWKSGHFLNQGICGQNFKSLGWNVTEIIQFQLVLEENHTPRPRPQPAIFSKTKCIFIYTTVSQITPTKVQDQISMWPTRSVIRAQIVTHLPNFENNKIFRKCLRRCFVNKGCWISKYYRVLWTHKQRYWKIYCRFQTQIFQIFSHLIGGKFELIPLSG